MSNVRAARCFELVRSLSDRATIGPIDALVNETLFDITQVVAELKNLG